MRRFRSDESGQSLILIVLSMTVIIAVAAFAIDAATWMHRRHQTQVVADAAALAAANCLANPGSTAGSIMINGTKTTVPPCSNGTDTTSARTVAGDYAKANGVQITNPSSQIAFNTSTDHVTVSAATTSAGFFSTAFGIGPTTQTASAQATWTTPTSNSCSTPGNTCAAVFAMGTSCSNTGSQPGGSPIIFSGSDDTITGAVHSNGSIYEAGGGDQKLGPTTYGNGNGSGCEIDTDHESGDTWNGSSTMPSAGEPAITTWPDDYSTVLTACGGTGQVACTGPCVNSGDLSTNPCTPPIGGTTDKCESSSDNCTGTPAYCTQGSASWTFGNGAASLPTNNVWCAFGGSSSSPPIPSDPSKYTGLIEFQSGSLGSASTPIYGTWIAGTVDVDHKSYLSTQTSTPTFPVFYAAGSGSCSSSTSGGACMTAYGNTINGAIFAPNGWIEFNGNGTTTSNFLEAQGIYFNGGDQTVLGTGPTNITGPSSSPGTDALTQ